MLSKALLIFFFSFILVAGAVAQTQSKSLSALSSVDRPLSQQMAATVMNIWKDSFSLEENRPARWSYDQGVILKGFENIWVNTGIPRYFEYIQRSMDFFVADGGNSIRGYRPDEYNIDHINNGKLLLFLFRVTGQQKYLKAAQLLREQLRTHPRTQEGGFWHKKIYPWQMWLDGLYMGQPFYAEYAMLAHEDSAFNDIANQFVWMEKHARDPKTGLLYHGWDESRQQRWANKETGNSPHFWGRAMGWYGMAMVDVLDYFPKDHPRRKEIIDILNRWTTAVEKVQDKKTGAWYDILDQPDRKPNYLEASGSCMMVYTIAKGVRLGYLPASKLSIAQKGYEGIKNTFIKVENGQTNLHGTVKVSGLGGDPYRDGSFEYYMREPVIVNDPKGVGAFLLASSEMERASDFTKFRGRTIALDNFFNSETKTDAFGKTVNWHYKWTEYDNPGFLMFGRAFTNYGASLTMVEEPTAQSLQKADVYIIVDPDFPKENKSPHYIEQKHVDAIADWVKNGGVLLLMGNDSGNAEFEHWNQLASKFGMRFDVNSVNRVQGQQWEQGTVTLPGNNGVFKNISKVYLKELSTLQLTAPAKALVTQNGQVIMALAKYGKGTVFAVGDPWLYNEYVDGRRLPMEWENHRAANDLARWLLEQTRPRKR
jgi:unsaturated rhamnogalacturonyl hydrolase